MQLVDRAKLAKDAKEALNLLHSARIRCEQIGLSRLFVDIDSDYVKMAQAASLARIRLTDPQASKGAVRRVAREASTVLSLVDAAEKSMREHGP